MDSRATLLVIFTVLGLLSTQVQADFYFQRPAIKPEDIDIMGYECVPGRTYIKVKHNEQPMGDDSSADADDFESTRSHMGFPSRDSETCQICVCSVTGKAEKCSKRPAMNLNECLKLAELKTLYQKGAYDDIRILPLRVRRGDYIWHNGEIPYDPTASCYRGHSYYTNDPKADDTAIGVPESDDEDDLAKYLNHKNKTVCFYCVCGVNGAGAGCLARSSFYCEYFRVLRQPHATRDRYRHIFEQDRPVYFSQLSWRLRRKMDNGVYDLISTGGDALCCNHPSGHRRIIHNRVSQVFRNFKRKIPKENLLGGDTRDDYMDFIVNNDKRK